MLTQEDKTEIIGAMKEELVLTMKAMQPELEKTVADKIEIVVNGKINRLQMKIDEHIEATVEHREKVDTFIEHITPLGDAVSFLQILRTFVVWGSGFAIAFGIMWAAIVNLPNLFK